ncbi:MAG: epoxyqueuosine reductase QueH [Planctomycetota bacterium]|nr:epoxyqueuosine reductase QueH [Planctomycetota bacterium]
MTVLVHVCCAACALAVLEPLRRAGRVVLHFYNPNIHPLIEFRRRLTAVQVLAERERIDLIADGRYGLREFLAQTAPWDCPARCLACWRLRLAETARVAAERGFEAVTTTLLSSSHQDHESIRRIGQEIAAEKGLRFHYEDFRPLAAKAHEEAKRLNLYRQQYCGCIFSEEERFAPTRLHLHRATADDRGTHE